MQRFGAGGVKENPCQVRLNKMGSIGRYSSFVKNPESLAKLQA